MSEALKIKKNSKKTKILIIFLCIGFIFFFYLATNRYKLFDNSTPTSVITNSIEPTISLKNVAAKISFRTDESEADSIERCGDFPTRVFSKIYGGGGRFSVYSGGRWSPDCQNIAWSIKVEGHPGGWLGEETPMPTEIPRVDTRDGIFLYRVSSDAINRIYIPKSPQETPRLIGWTSNDIITFSSDVSYQFDINLEKIKKVK